MIVRFRWAACQLDSLGNCFDLPHLRQALEALPKTLDDTYARILCNIDKDYDNYKRSILKILQWLTLSARPLQLEEIAELITINVDETPGFDPARRFPDPRDILTICSSLITLTKHFNNPSDEESGGELSEHPQDPDPNRVAEVSDPENSTTYVRLAHFSVKEYLVSDRIQHGTAPDYRIREIESHGVLAEDCLAYLLQFDEPGSLTDGTLELSPLAGYAAEFWPRHARVAEKASIKSTTFLSMELLMSDGEGFLNWIRICDPDVYNHHFQKNLSRRLDDLAPPLYYASLAGLFRSVKMLIEGSVNVNAQGGYYGNALQAAAFSGHIDVVGLLLDSGANVNAQGGVFGNALQAASFKRHIDVVRVLLKREANINAQGGYCGHALPAAEHIDVVGLLLDNGADVNAEGGPFGNALCSACAIGDKERVKLLLHHGAEFNSQGGDVGNALTTACDSGHEETVELLLDNGANVNTRSGRAGESPLSAASRRGHEKVVKMLIAKGAVMEKEDAIEEGDPPAQHFQEIDPIPTPAGVD